jgi:glycosyltransferase involved in cell wall biosynthesis
MTKLIRITTVPQSLRGLLCGQLKYMSQFYETIGISSSGPPLEDVKKNEGIRIITVEMTRSITPLKDIRAVRVLYKVFKNEKPVIVHTHTPKAGTLGMLAAKLAGVPIRMHTVAGLPLMEATGFKRKILDRVEKITYWCANVVYPNSKGLEQFIIENNYTKPEKVKVIGNGSSNGIDTGYFNRVLYTEEMNAELRGRLGIPKEDFVYLFVGRLVGDKGINELITAFSKIQKSDVKLLLVGSFESELDPLTLITLNEIKANPNIISTGFQEDVRPYFSISEALVFPSYREGFPNVVMQAGAMGLPSIVTDINGCNEIVKDAVNGLIIPPKDTELLQKSMELLMSDNALYKKLQSNARIMIVERYEQRIVWEAILEEYQKAITALE